MAFETPVSDARPLEPSADLQVRPGKKETEEEISLLDLLIVIAERKSAVLFITASFTLLAIVVSLLLPVRYTATVILLPPQSDSTSSILSTGLSSLSGMAALAGSSSLGLKNPNDMYVAMLKSLAVEDAMIQRFGLMDEYHKRYLSDARKKFEHRVDIDGSGKDGLIHISVEDRDPRRAAEMANGYVEEYRRLSQHLAITEASQRRLFFEQQLEQAKDNLAGAEEALKETEQKTGMIQLNSQAAVLIESAASLRAQIAAKEVEIQGMRTFATGQNAQLIEAEQELDGLRAQLSKLGGSEDSSSGLIVPKGLVPQAGLEYVRKYRDVKYFETLFEIIARQFELAKIDEARQGAIVQVVDPAIVPDKKSFPPRWILVACGFLLGLIGGICTALVSAAVEHMRSVPLLNAKFLSLKQAIAWKAHTSP